ncbi:MAG: MarR family transcriptional regulator [Acidimicrobiales bacterium]
MKIEEAFVVGESSKVAVDASIEELDADLSSAVSRLVRRVRAEKSSDQISDSHRSALAVLVREGPRTLSELSEFERVKPPSMNQTVNALVDLGYVERRDDPADGRKVILAATRSGRALIEETGRRFHAWLQPQLAALSDEDRDVLCRAATIIHKIADS